MPAPDSNVVLRSAIFERKPAREMVGGGEAEPSVMYSGSADLVAVPAASLAGSHTRLRVSME